MDRPARRRSPRPLLAILATFLLVAAACEVTYVPTPSGSAGLAVPSAKSGGATDIGPTATTTATAPQPTPTASPRPSATPRPTTSSSPSASAPPAGAGSAAAFAPCPGRVTTAGSGPLATDTSTNWSGYAATAVSATFSCVEATWTQPTVRCTSARSAVSIWVGLGGFDQVGLEQIGSEVDCEHGSPTGYLWHESLPLEHYEVPIRLAVRRGDRLRAQVRALTSTTYQLSIANLTRGTVFTVRDTNPRLHPTSAEWVVESPTGGCPADCHILPMPNFGQLTVSGTWLTVGGFREPLDGADATHSQITMLAPDGSIRAQVTGTAASGTSFTVAWVRS
ncbi:MAG: G1 family glutamic endopeptidase [Candidatus Limnocylindrales bacterium]